MKSVLIALPVALAFTAGAALAQQTPPTNADHSAHHPQSTQAEPTAQPAQPPPGSRGPAAQTSGHSGTGGMGMMSCPMMQGMAGMMGGRGTMTGMGSVARRGDESLPSLAFKAANDKMHRDMEITYTGNVEADFAKAMIAHHQGAIDMAKITVAFGKDAQIRKLAEDIVKAQEAEIATLKDWLAKAGR